VNQLPQQYQVQLLQEIIGVVVALAIIAMVISDAVKAIKEAARH
jgi:hypothetical protein